MFSRLSTVFTLAMVTGALLIAFIAGTGAASASTIDNQFLTAIDAEGIVFDTAKAAVQDGHLVCSFLADGETGASIGGDIMDSTDLTAHQAAVFVVEAASAYCPGYLDQVTA
jgi:hypothetical protein